MFKKGQVICYLNSDNKENFENCINNSSLKGGISKENDNLKSIIDCLTPGTILGYSLDEKENQDILCIPAMSLHLSMPLKPGEYFWYFEDENIKATPVKTLSFVNKYWLSRVHGTLFSEDLNFSFRERDSDYKSEEVNDTSTVESLDFKSEGVFDARTYSVGKNTNILYKEGINENSLIDKAVPRYLSRSDELCLQGSYNSLINLTKIDFRKEDKKPGGAIDLVAGRKSLYEYSDKATTPLEKDNVKYRLNTYNKTTNVENSEELFKMPASYLNEDVEFEDVESDDIDNIQDASRILISECSILDSLINSNDDKFYDNENLENVFIADYSKIIPTVLTKHESTSKRIKKDNAYLSEASKILIENPARKNIDFFSNQSIPSILVKSNDIRIVARKEMFKSDELFLPDGSIRIIKEGSNFIENSHILMERDGNLNIDGNMIFIGSFEKEAIKNIYPEDIDLNYEEFYEKIKNEDDAAFKSSSSLDAYQNLEFANNKNIKKMHGKGNGVILGYHPNLSEPLVLGNTLHAVLKEILTINIAAFNLIAASIEEINTTFKSHNHLHPQAPTTGLVNPPVNTKSNDAINNLKEGGTKVKEIKNIINNLNEILSRFAKTS
jgi:hypothetical protein